MNTGFDAVVKEMASVKSKISGVLAANDVSAKTLKEINFEAVKYNKKVINIDVSMSEIETVLKKRVGIIGILDEGLFKLF